MGCYIMELHSHLAPRGKGGIYQLRLVVPPHLRQFIGRREFTRSLGSSDRRDAARQALPILAEWNAIIDEAGLVVGNIDPGAIAFEVGYEQLLARLERSRRSVPAGADAFQAYTRKRETELLNLVRRRRDGQFDVWEGIADRTIENRGMALVKGSDEHSAFVMEIADFVIEAVSLDNRRNTGELHAEPRNESIRQRLRQKDQQPAPGETTMQLFERYAAQRLLEKRKRPASIEKDRKIIGCFADFVGADRAVGSIIKKDVRDWIDARAAMPRGYEKMRRFADMTLRSAVKVAAGDISKRVSAKTLNSYLSAVSAFFAWLISRDHHQGPSPCDGVYFDATKGDNPRPPFTTDQLNAIFKSPLFTGFAGEGLEHEPGDDCTRDWRFWIPLVCLFTGARVSEIAQLRVGDIREDHGGWQIFISHNAEAGQTTKSGNSRIVPVHSKLAEIGFVLFCGDQSKGGDKAQPLFPEAEDPSRSNAGDRASRFWRDYLESIEVKSSKVGGDGLGVHSFRHTIADRFREEAELLDTEIGLALGHTVKTVTSGYGKVRQGTVNMLRDMFEAVRFDGVELEHLKPNKVLAV